MRKRIERFYNKCGIDEFGSEIFSWLTALFIIGFFLVRIGMGMKDANDPNGCKAHSVADVLLSPAYAIGCNLTKNRFDFKLN